MELNRVANAVARPSLAASMLRCWTLRTTLPTLSQHLTASAPTCQQRRQINNPSIPSWALPNRQQKPQEPTSSIVSPRVKKQVENASSINKNREATLEQPASKADPYDFSAKVTFETSEIVKSLAFETPEKEYRPLRLTPQTGRTIHVKNDVAQALRYLDSLVRQNKVMRELRLQKYHERPGLRRKRVKSERWRYRFKVGFANTCARVTELRKQGW